MCSSRYISTFFNPKAGVTYQIDPKSNVYLSFGVGNHEPDRDDYTQSTPDSRPKPENLKDWELGYRTQQGYIHRRYQRVLYAVL